MRQSALRYTFRYTTQKHGLQEDLRTAVHIDDKGTGATLSTQRHTRADWINWRQTFAIAPLHSTIGKATQQNTGQHAAGTVHRNASVSKMLLPEFVTPLPLGTGSLGTGSSPSDAVATVLRRTSSLGVLVGGVFDLQTEPIKPSVPMESDDTGM